MIDIKILTFLTLAKLRSYTKTAEALNMTQPAVSQHIKNIEKTYQVLLFNRNNKSVSLTEQGEVFYNYAEQLYYCNESLLHFLKSKETIQQYSISMNHTIAEDIGARIISEHHHRFPEISYSIRVENMPELLERLNKRDICLALVEAPFDKKKYPHVFLKKDSLYVVSAKENQLSPNGKITIQQLMQQPLIQQEPRSGSRTIFENALFSFGYSISDFKSVLEVNSIRFIKKMILQNMGVAILSYERIRHEIEHDMVNYYEIEDMPLHREFHILYNKTHETEPFITSFIRIATQINIHDPQDLTLKPW